MLNAIKAIIPRKTNSISFIDRVTITQIYEGKSVREITDHFDGKYTRDQIKNFCYNNNLVCRKQTLKEISERSRVHARKNGRTQLNEEFFEKWSNNMAYILGLWFADGHIRHRANSGGEFAITLHEDDKHVLEDIKKEMNSEHKIYYPTKTSKCLRLSIYSSKITDNIEKLGGTTAKSLTVQFPEVPKKYMRHFIRGYFDGDGSIRKEMQNTITFTCGSMPFLEKLDKILLDNDIQKTNFRADKRSNGCEIILSRKVEIIKLCHYMYDNLDESDIYMKRKYDIAKERYL